MASISSHLSSLSNRFLAPMVVGVGALMAVDWVGQSITGRVHPVIAPFAAWSNDFGMVEVVTGIFLLVMIYVSGLSIDFVFQFLWRLLPKSVHGWYERVTEYSSEGWLIAQRWIWESPAANAEFSHHRFLASIGAGAISILTASTLIWVGYSAVVGFREGFGAALSWLFPDVLQLLVSLVVAVGFWLHANRLYHRLVNDAGKMGPPGGPP